MQRENTRSMAIDVLKCLATLAIFNHLSGPLYGRWSFLGTGGVLGVTLFFFISGFTLYLGRLDRFDNWYKRRLGRVWPTAFVASAAFEIFLPGIFGGALFAFAGSGWFTRDILIAYAVLYMARAIRVPPVVAFLVAIVAACAWFFFCFDYTAMTIFGGGLMRSIALYSFLFLGGAMATYQEKFKIHPIVAACVAVLSFVVFNLLAFLISKKLIDGCYQLALLFIQLLFVFTLYFSVKGIRMTTCVRNIILFIGGLSLEMYFTYSLIRTAAFNGLFPLNIAINLAIGLTFAYFMRCLARVFKQTFQKEPYDWRAVFALI